MSRNFMTVDGNGAAAYVAYQFTEIAAIYPITPSSPMAGATDRWSANGRKNMFGQKVRLTEMQSEAGAIGAVHGALQAGALATSYTSSQGLMLMIPVLYRIAGERLPAVLHVASRTVGTHALSIFGDHSDVMACRQTGFAQLCSGSVQEAADLAAIAHLSAVKGGIPFMHFFDGFRTSHELSRIDMPDLEKLSGLLDRAALEKFRHHALNPEHPELRATVQNGDVYFQVREAHNPFYDVLPDIVEDYMQKAGEITGRTYHLFDYYGDPDATDVLIAMGSVSGAAREAVDYLNNHAADGHRYGYLQVHLYRPFSVKHFIQALPASVRRIAVLDRCKEMGAIGEPLYLDVAAAVSEMERLRAEAACKTADGAAANCPAPDGRDRILVIGGRYGLSSKDTDPAQIVAAFENLSADEPVRSFTIGIEDDVTHLSLPVRKIEGIGDSSPESDIYSCKFWGLGGDGTVGANHNTVQILGDCADMYAQAYFEYDAKKSFGITKSHIRLSKAPIQSSYYVKAADFVACHNQSYIDQYEIVEEVKPGGSFLLNCTWGEDPAELAKHLPKRVQRQIAEKKIHFYVINATAIAEELGLGSHTNTVLQAAFFKVSGLMPVEEALENMKEAARRTYFAKGDAVVAQNVAAIDAGADKVVEVAVPAAWAELSPDAFAVDPSLPDVVKNILIPINRQKGDDLPVSAFKGREDGVIDMGLTAYEKRGIAVNVPQWDAEKCIQCNQCAFVCPHAAIRPYLLTKEEAANAPAGFVTVPVKGAKPGSEAAEYLFSMQISDYDCTGCGSCANVCPVKDKALSMQPAELNEQKKQTWSYGLSLSDKGDVFDPHTIKGSQFRQPLLEFSAACAGCAETSYAKLLTQLFGDRIYWANGTGCSQAWGSAMPGIPYTVNKRGFGPAWTNSLFENNAELEWGLFLSVQQQREAERMRVEALAEALTKAGGADTASASSVETAQNASEPAGETGAVTPPSGKTAHKSSEQMEEAHRTVSASSVETAQTAVKQEKETPDAAAAAIPGMPQNGRRTALLDAIRAWFDAYEDYDGSRKASDALIEALEAYLADGADPDFANAVSANAVSANAASANAASVNAASENAASANAVSANAASVNAASENAASANAASVNAVNCCEASGSKTDAVAPAKTDADADAAKVARIARDETSPKALAAEILNYRDQLAKKTFWMYGGDGWAYDIGFGGLDHVIAQGENINVLVVDTEVYSNTGGQSSKATPIGAVAQFASSGKRSRKKDLGAIMMTYGNVYVAQVAMGADMNQLVKVLKEAEEYNGPSVVIAYCPCVSHGIKGGMSKVQDEMKRAVASGYWTLYHYDPRKEHPMHVDSREPSMDYQDFLDGESRYASLKKTFPENARELFAIAKEDAKKRYQKYKAME